jgi:allophanate hydrolase
VPPENLLSATVRVAVVGAHLSGMPLNWQLKERGAWREQVVQSCASYRLYALPKTQPPKPGMLRVVSGEGSAIEMEVWRMPVEYFGSFVALIAAPLGIGSIELDDGSFVQGFVCEQWAVEGALDVSRFGGWKAYVASLNQQKGL